MFCVYVLKLESGKYYIGKTNDLEKRYQQHASKNGSVWTKKYPPERILEVFEKADIFEENKQTIKYMSMYGIDNVRGGAFCTIDLEESDKNAIHKIISSCLDKCLFCGQTKHFSSGCEFNKNLKVKVVFEKN